MPWWVRQDGEKLGVSRYNKPVSATTPPRPDTEDNHSKAYFMKVYCEKCRAMFSAKGFFNLKSAGFEHLSRKDCEANARRGCSLCDLIQYSAPSTWKYDTTATFFVMSSAEDIHAQKSNLWKIFDTQSLADYLVAYETEKDLVGRKVFKYILKLVLSTDEGTKIICRQSIYISLISI